VAPYVVKTEIHVDFAALGAVQLHFRDPGDPFQRLLHLRVEEIVRISQIEF
jgi:hypothetical protein